MTPATDTTGSGPVAGVPLPRQLLEYIREIMLILERDGIIADWSWDGDLWALQSRVVRFQGEHQDRVFIVSRQDGDQLVPESEPERRELNRRASHRLAAVGQLSQVSPTRSTPRFSSSVIRSASSEAAFDRTAEGIQRVRSIVTAMRRLSPASHTDLATADINEAIETTLTVCRNEYKYVAQIERDLGELGPVVCKIDELSQVFLNLIINAAHAIEEKIDGGGAPGLIRVATRVEGEDAVIEVSDDGPGIQPALQERIFEPIFTTEKIGKGTGQGLALALAAVQRHGGSIEWCERRRRGNDVQGPSPAASPAREDGARGMMVTTGSPSRDAVHAADQEC